MKKIKIIDLLNMIANGEEVPERIKFGEMVWYFEENNYINKNLNPNFIDSNKRYFLGTYNFNVLNDEVEIVEDKSTNKIEKLDTRIEQNIKGNYKWVVYNGGNKYTLSTPQKIIANKLNEIIDVLNELKNKEND